MANFATYSDTWLKRGAAFFEDALPSVAVRRWERVALVALLLLSAVVRFWGLGSFGLHKPDEDTTALPALHILEDGSPRFPSGMFYARAIGQSYLIAASVEAFGESEWSIRLPSAVCGVLLVLLSYFLGRRFLEPVWNTAFVASVAFLPGFIADSQEARMYGFMVASLAGFSILVFRWERTGRTVDLVAAVAIMMLALQFQVLAVFGAALVLFPGVLHADGRRFAQGSLALLAIALGYLVISKWNASFYPPKLTDFAPIAPALGRPPSAPALRLAVLLPLGLIGAAAIALLVALRRARMGRDRLMVGTLFLGAFVLQSTFHYHLAIFLMIGALLIARRGSVLSWSALAVIFGISAAAAAAQVFLLHRSGVESIRNVVGIMIGSPSIWPYLKTGEYSPAALVLLVIGMALAIGQFAARRKIADYWLFLLLSALLPLFGIGFFGWYFPPRYTEFAVLPMLVCALGFVQQIAAQMPAQTLLAAAAGLLLVNPFAAAEAINAGNSFADHRGAAQFVRSIARKPNDIIVAEEVLMQTFYLGHIDYWLTSPALAAEFGEREGGRVVDEYTHTPVITTVADLEALINRPGRGSIYLIGSGEGGDREHERGAELSKFMLNSKELTQIFVGRDKATIVWRIDARRPPP